MDSDLNSIPNSWLSCLIDKTCVDGAGGGGSGKDSNELDDFKKEGIMKLGATEFSFT